MKLIGLPFLTVIGASIPVCCSAQLPTERAAGTSWEPAIPFQVLTTRKIDLGDRSIYLNRVAPPTMPRRPSPAAGQEAPALSSEDADRSLRQESKKSELLFLFATVFDRGVTVLHWSAGGREYRALSNIDFNYFTTRGQIETEDTVYGLMLAIGNEPSEALDPERGSLISRLSKTRSEYILIEDKEQAAPDASLTGLDALHVYFDTHRQKLIEDYQKREADRVEQEQWLKAHPPAPKDTVINFWPGKTTIFSDAPRRRDQ